MTGAAACLAGFSGLQVVIHGSSGCYYYPASLLHAPLHGTFILENEVVFGSEERLNDTIAELSGTGGRIAVITTCVPSILGEDIRSMLAAHDVLLVDSPGFAGDLETGYRAALEALQPVVDPERDGVNIDGVSLSDPFSRGNVQELTRLLAMASVMVGTVFSCDRLEQIRHAAPFTIGSNDDFRSGLGTCLGSTLGFEATRETFTNLAGKFDGADIDPVLREAAVEEERVIHVCDKYLRRYDPPSVTIFAGVAYALFAAQVLERYLDAAVLFVGTRNEPPDSCYPIGQVKELGVVRAHIQRCAPDLVIGSSFERSVSDGRAFVGMILPFRDKVRLSHQPVAGTGGTLHFIENVLNACRDRKPVAPQGGVANQ
jgi:nitrogenase molybdenum-iron protein alpha/beta subunit